MCVKSAPRTIERMRRVADRKRNSSSRVETMIQSLQWIDSSRKAFPCAPGHTSKTSLTASGNQLLTFPSEPLQFEAFKEVQSETRTILTAVIDAFIPKTLTCTVPRPLSSPSGVVGHSEVKIVKSKAVSECTNSSTNRCRHTRQQDRQFDSRGTSYDRRYSTASG